MVAFYSQADQDIYDEGDHFIPQEQYRLGKFRNTVAPMPMDSTQQVTQEFGIPYTGAFTNAGGGGAGPLNKYGIDTSRGNMKEFHNQNVWTEVKPGKYDWVNQTVEGFWDPNLNTYKTAEGKNIEHGGHFTGEPEEGDIEGVPFKFPSITTGIIEWLRNKTQGVKDQFTGGKDGVVDEKITTDIATTSDGNKDGMPQGSWGGHGSVEAYDKSQADTYDRAKQAHNFADGGRIGFQDGGSDYGQFERRQAHNIAAGPEAMNVGGGDGQGDGGQGNTGGITQLVDDGNIVDVDWKTVDPSVQLNLDRSRYLAQLDLLESIKNQELEGQIGATLGPVDFTTMINEGNIGNTNINYDNWSANFDPNANLQNISYKNNIGDWDVGASYSPEGQNYMIDISKTFKHGGLARIL